MGTWWPPRGEAVVAVMGPFQSVAVKGGRIDENYSHGECKLGKTITVKFVGIINT